jgi:hypothetical protein
MIVGHHRPRWPPPLVDLDDLPSILLAAVCLDAAFCRLKRHALCLFRKVFLKQSFRPRSALFRQHNGFGFGRWIVNVAALIQAVEDIPAMALPRPRSCSVLERGQVTPLHS